MLKSMTGFGMSVTETKDKKITVEIKSLNHKFIETIVKMPNIFSDKELDIKNECTKNLGRGKIYVTINIEDTNTETYGCLNVDIISGYYTALSKLAEKLNAKTTNLFESVLYLPEVTKSTTLSLDKKESDWQLLKKTLTDALIEINKYRNEEGKSLYDDIIKRILTIENIVTLISELEVKQRDDIRGRINKKILDLSLDIDNIRIEQEMLFYIERCSITEEIIRLQHHCKFFKDSLASSESKGKKLSFIIQEILRELNTINAKSIDPEIQKLAIDAKEEVDNIKEQLFNVL